MAPTLFALGLGSHSGVQLWPTPLLCRADASTHFAFVCAPPPPLPPSLRTTQPLTFILHVNHHRFATATSTTMVTQAAPASTVPLPLLLTQRLQGLTTTALRPLPPFDWGKDTDAVGPSGGPVTGLGHKDSTTRSECCQLCTARPDCEMFAFGDLNAKGAPGERARCWMLSNVVGTKVSEFSHATFLLLFVP